MQAYMYLSNLYVNFVQQFYVILKQQDYKIYIFQ